MKTQVDIWFYGNTKAPNGVASFISILKESFALHGNTKLKVFSNDKMINSNVTGVQLYIKNTIIKLKKQVKIFLEIMVRASNIIAYIYI
jgi:hypothetical protein